MSLLADPEDEYLDDLIQLIPSPSDDVLCTPELEEFSSYQQKSYVPVTFFNIDKNIKLLNNCRPLCIKLVDCNQYPWYYKKFNKKYRYRDSSDNMFYTVNESGILSTEAERILNRISSNGLTIKRMIGKHKMKKKIKGIDYKKNRGLIGMKVSRTLEVIEIDSESDASNNEIDCNAMESSSKNLKTDSSACMIPVNKAVVKSDATEQHKNELNCCLNVNVSEKKLNLATNNDSIDDKQKVNELGHFNSKDKEQKLMSMNNLTGDKLKPNEHNMEINSKPSDHLFNINSDQQIDKVKEITDIDNKSKDAIKKDQNKSNQLTTCVEEVVKKNIPSSTKYTLNTPEIKPCNGARTKETRSPVFPCTPPKKSKKIEKSQHKSSMIIISQPHDFIDERFKPNRICGPNNNKQTSPEKVKYLQSNLYERVSHNKTMTIANCEQRVTLNNGQIKLDENVNRNIIESIKSSENYIGTEVQHGTTDSIRSMFDVSSLTNEKCEFIKVNSDTADKRSLQNLPSQEGMNDKESKLEKIFKDDIETQTKINYSTHNETQSVNPDSTTSNVSSQVNKTYQLTTSTISPLDQTQPCHLNEKRLHMSHNPDTVSAQNKQENTSKPAPKRVAIFQRIGSAVLRQEPNSTSLGCVDKRHQYNVLSKNRMEPFTGLVSSWSNVVNEMAKKNISQSSKSLCKERNIGISSFHHGSDVALQNSGSKIPFPPQDMSKQIKNKTSNATAHAIYKDTSELQNKATVLVGNGSNCSSHNSAVYLNERLNDHLQNVSHISEHSESKNRCHCQNCCIPSFRPQHRQFVRPMMRHGGAQVLSGRNYPRHIYPNHNTVPMTRYPPGYTNNFNSYWPYIYSRVPPPPPPPPPPQPPLTINSRVDPNISHSPGLVNKLDKNKVSVVKQMNITAGPASEKVPVNNNFLNRPNQVDNNVNTNPPKAPNSSSVNNSPVLSSKLEMFKELEKEMMNIHHEDPEYFIKQQLKSPEIKHKKFDHRNNAYTNMTHISEPLKNKDLIEFQNREHNSIKKSQNVKPIKIPSSEIVSNLNVTRNNTLTACDETQNFAQGYSPPILPIPSFQKTLEILTRASKDAQKCLDAKEKSCKQTLSTNGDLKKDKVKKISLDEYKNRDDKRVCERMKRKYERKKEKKAVKECVETKNSDQDQGYDSDTTVVL